MKNIIALTMMMSFSLIVFAQRADSIKAPKITLRDIPTSAIEPLIIIDGNKQYIRGNATLNAINQDDIKSMSVYKDSTAIAKYGLDCVGGVIEIVTKSKSVTNGTRTIVSKNGSGSDLQRKAIGITIRAQNPPQYRQDNSTFSITKDGIKLKNEADKPLYIIDGKEGAYDEYFDKKSIQSIEVIKDAASTSAYGEKGKNGVIIITNNKSKALQKKN